MKNIYKKAKLLTLVLLLIGCATTKAQLAFIVNNGVNYKCYNGGPNTVSIAITNTVASATGYSWTINNPTTCTATWTNAVSNGSLINMTFPCVGNYSICCTAMNGTAAVGFQCSMFYIYSNPVVTISASSPSVCSGGSISLSGAGAITYTWLPSNFGGGTFVGNPTSSTCYTLIGASSQGCSAFATQCTSVSPTPTINVTGNSSLCPGGSATLTATGAATYVWSNSTTGSAIVVTPTASTCYSVMGSSIQGCSVTTLVCVTLLPTPTINVTGSSTVCLGSSAVFTVSGAISYTWSNGSTGTTLSVLPLVSANYSIIGIGSNGCIGYVTTSVIVDTTCSNVWPGDANSDGLVDNTDVFEIGLAFSGTGTARTPGGNSYASQYANNWVGTVSSGKNKCHADCNGDGTVNNGDTLAIYNNYSLTHSFKPSGISGPLDIYLTAPAAAMIGNWNFANIIMGDGTTNINLYGVAFDLAFDKNLVDINSAYITYIPSFLNASSQNVEFRKLDYSNGKIYGASVRVNGTNVLGSGKIGEFWYKLKSGIPDHTQVNMSITNAKKTDKLGVKSNLNGGSAFVYAGIVGITEQNIFDQSLGFYPNPASDKLIVTSTSKNNVTYTIFDIVGRKINEGEFNNSTTLNISELNAGTYIVQLHSGPLTTYKKLVIEK